LIALDMPTLDAISYYMVPAFGSATDDPKVVVLESSILLGTF